MSGLAPATAAYRLEPAPDGLLVRLSDGRGRPMADLRPHAAVDTVAGPDETLAVEPPRPTEGGFVFERRSTLWERAGTTLLLREDGLELRPWVEGRGSLADAHLLALRSLLPGQPLGLLPSGMRLRSLFSPNPGDPTKVVRPSGEPAVIGVAGDGTPGRGHWLFTPAPLALALTAASDADPEREVADGWLQLALVASVQELRFVQLAHVAGAGGGFHLTLDYDGHTTVEGRLELPALVLTPELPTPYEGLRRYRAELTARRLAPEPAPRVTPAWWKQPLFCGWGAQCGLARGSVGRFAGDFSTQTHYDEFLAHLEAEGVVPGTVVLDDKWQSAYGTNEPDPEKWPDLAGWIGARHARGQRVLLWWKAWDPEGLPPELCVRNPDGAAVALDPTNHATEAMLRAQMERLLGPAGLDADGLKIDFTARTPSGRALEVDDEREGWGIALLHRLLALVYRAAKEAKPDALVLTHTPHPSFADVTDMIRLNDMMRTDEPHPGAGVVAQMRHRAEVARAAVPELPIDTDDWCVPSLEEWREYVEAKPLLGVPSLYYANAVDATGESFEERDYEALRRTWAEWREAHGLVSTAGGAR